MIRHAITTRFSKAFLPPILLLAAFFLQMHGAQAAPPLDAAQVPPSAITAPGVVTATVPLTFTVRGEVVVPKLAAISPDSRRVVAHIGDNVCIYLIEGGTEQCVLAPDSVGEFRWSPDGRYIAYAEDIRQGVKPTVWVLDVVSGQATNLSEDKSADLLPRWSAESDALLVVHVVSKDGKPYIGLRRITLPDADVTDLDVEAPAALADMAWDSRTNRVAFGLAFGKTEPNRGIAFFDLNGEEPPRFVSMPGDRAVNLVAFAPQGGALLVRYTDTETRKTRLAIYDWETEALREMAPDMEVGSATWLPNGGGIAFALGKGAPGLYVLPLSPEGAAPIPLGSYAPAFPTFWSDRLNWSATHTVIVKSPDTEGLRLLRSTGEVLDAPPPPPVPLWRIEAQVELEDIPRFFIDYIPAPDGTPIAITRFNSKSKQTPLCLYTLTGDEQGCAAIGESRTLFGLDVQWSPDSRFLAAMPLVASTVRDPGVWLVDQETPDAALRLQDGDRILHAPIWSPDGTLLTLSNAPDDPEDVDLVRWAPATMISETAAVTLPAISGPIMRMVPAPDGERLFYEVTAHGADDDARGLWMADRKAATVTRLLSYAREEAESSFLFSPEGGRLLVLLHTRTVDGEVRSLLEIDLESGKVTPLDEQRAVFAATWSPDGRFVAYVASDEPGARSTDMRLRVVHAQGGLSSELGAYRWPGGRPSLAWTAENWLLARLPDGPPNLHLLRLTEEPLPEFQGPFYRRYENAEGGFSLFYPAGWQMDEDKVRNGVQVLFISDEDALRNTAKPAGLVVVETHDESTADSTPRELHEQALENSGLDVTPVNKRISVEMENYVHVGQTFTATVPSGAVLTFRASTVVYPDRWVFIASGTMADEEEIFTPLIQTILDSLDLGEPSPYPGRVPPQPVQTLASDADFTRYVDELGLYALRHPVSWTFKADKTSKGIEFQIVSDPDIPTSGPPPDQAFGFVFGALTLSPPESDDPQALQEQWLKETDFPGKAQGDWTVEESRAWRTYTWAPDPDSPVLQLRILTVVAEERFVHLVGGVVLPDETGLAPVVNAILDSVDLAPFAGAGK